MENTYNKPPFIAMHLSHRLKTLPMLAMLCLTSLAHAQPAAAAPLALQATNLSGERFAAQERLRGKVSIVFFWSTACAVCRESLHEVRANLAGWRDKPFALVTGHVERQWIPRQQREKQSMVDISFDLDNKRL